MFCSNVFTGGLGGLRALIGWNSKTAKKTARNVTETTFLALFSPFFYPLPLNMAKFRHCSMRQSKVRTENAQHARDLVVTHLGCDIWDTRKFVFYPKKYSQFHRLIVAFIASSTVHISLYRLFIAFIQCILSSEWSWKSYCSSICSCPQHVVEWPCGQVGPKQLFMLSRGDRFDSVMI